MLSEGLGAAARPAIVTGFGAAGAIAGSYVDKLIDSFL